MVRGRLTGKRPNSVTTLEEARYKADVFRRFLEADTPGREPTEMRAPALPDAEGAWI